MHFSSRLLPLHSPTIPHSKGVQQEKAVYLTFLSYHKQFSFKYLFAHVKGTNSNFAFAVRLFVSSSDDELNPRDYSQEVVDAEPF